MVNTYAVQSGGCRFESLWGFGFYLKGAHYEVDYCGKKIYLAGLQCTLTSSCAKSTPLSVNIVISMEVRTRGAMALQYFFVQKKSQSTNDTQTCGPLGSAQMIQS